MTGKGVMMITGTSRGIGQATARHFAADGYTVIGCSRSEAGFEHPNYRHYSLDLTDESATRSFVRSVKREFNRVDILVANVGLVDSSLFLAVTSADLYQKFLNTNLTSAFYICREVSKLMIAQQYGRIITISSIMATIHQPGTSIYSATKAALTEMTKVMARELAASNITCNVIAACLIETESSAALSSDARESLLQQQTIKRPATIGEFCHALEYLAAPQCSYLTGQVIDMCMAR
jgi:3-oxoacyl-[acyl-carrier protein] reductase